MAVINREMKALILAFSTSNNRSATAEVTIKVIKRGDTGSRIGKY